MRRGIAAVEFALIAPFFVTLILGTIELGRAIQVKQAVTNASREGARLLADRPAADATTHVLKCLAGAQIKSAQIEITKIDDHVCVTVKVPFTQVAYFPPFFYHGDIEGDSTFQATQP